MCAWAKNTLRYHMNQWVSGALGLAGEECVSVCVHVVQPWCCVGIIGDTAWPQKSPSF